MTKRKQHLETCFRIQCAYGYAHVNMCSRESVKLTASNFSAVQRHTKVPLMVTRLMHW